jgi:hypothetical protein
MAKDELLTVIRSARKLIGMLDNDDNMPEWTQKKITKSADYVDTAADYISSQKERGVMEQGVAEGAKEDMSKEVKAMATGTCPHCQGPVKKKEYPTLTQYHCAKCGIRASQDKPGVTEGSGETSPVARAVLHRIMMQHTGLLGQYGPERVMAAVDELADRVNIGPDDEIGSSDVSAYVREVERALSEQGVAEGEANAGETLRSQIIKLYKRGLEDYDIAYDLDIDEKIVADIIDDYDRKQQQRRAKQQGMAEGGFNDDGSYNTSDDEATDFDEYDFDDTELGEAEYQGRKVQLGKKMAGDVKKSKVYVKNPQGNVVKVNFGDPNMKIRKSNPGARKSFRARHNCDNPGPRHKARYWSCRAW